ncbi:hypothetical protein PQX77_000083 [Marasmius sp. AFHP31]|nr:hypothetical protein PQX77_000083 [Marasmius sp. AFHP31]
MKGTSIFSPRTWRKKRLQRDVSEPSTSDQQDNWNNLGFAPQTDSPYKSPTTLPGYSLSHAQSVVNLGSAKIYGELPDLPHSCPPSRTSSKPTLHSPSPRPLDGYRRSEETPRRPSRPPSLNLDSPKAERTPPRLSEVKRPRVPLTRSCTSPSPQPQTHVPCLRTKASLPELDGVWKGFLEEVEEDPHTLGASGGPRGLVLPSQRPRSVATSRSSSRAKRFQDLPPSPSFDKTLFESKAMPPLDNVHESETGDDDDLGLESPLTPDFSASLSLFPQPPPLTIRRKPIPKPLEIRGSPVSTLPPSPSSSSSDSTPLATPSTPTRTSILSPRRPPKSQDCLSLDYVSPTASPIRPPNRSFASDSALQRLHTTRSFYQPPRNRTQPLAASHRTTSSESISSCSSTDDEFRERVWQFPTSTPRYLETSGRKAPSPTYTPVQYGIAV